MLTNLNVNLDWVGWTTNLTFDNLLLYMGLTGNDLVKAPSGGYGYASRYFLATNRYINIYADGTDAMGIHVSVSGQGIYDFLLIMAKSLQYINYMYGNDNQVLKIKYFADSEYVSPEDFVITDNIVSFVLTDMLQYGAFTRIDVNMDDTIGFFTPDDIWNYWQNDRIVSDFCVCSRTQSMKYIECSGYTVYLGSRKSDCMLRIYDKRLERSKKDPDADVPDVWIRWEFEIKDLYANQFVLALIDDNGFSRELPDVYLELLNKRLRVIVRGTDSNKSRCKVLPEWRKFICYCQKKLKLFVRKASITAEKLCNWFDSCIGPSAFTYYVLVAHSGKYKDNMRKWASKLNRNQKYLVENEAGPEWIEHINNLILV